MQRLLGAGLLPGRAGQPVRAWVHLSLPELLALDGDGALLGQWTDAVRARWAGHRAAASVAGGDGAAWLDGDAAAAVACDALVSPVVTGDVDPGALDGLVRLCVELARWGRGRPGPGARPRSRGPAGRRGRRAGVPVPGGAGAGDHRQGRRAAVRPGRARVVPAPPAARRPAGRAQPAAGHRLQQHRPGRHPARRHPARPALPVGRRLHPARRRLPGPPRPPQGQRRPHQRQGLRPAVFLPPPGGHPPLGLDAGPEPGRDDDRVESGPDQGPAQPQPARPSRVTPPARRSLAAAHPVRRTAIQWPPISAEPVPRASSGCHWPRPPMTRFRRQAVDHRHARAVAAPVPGPARHHDQAVAQHDQRHP